MIAVDLFAGWGGFTLGAERAGCRVAWAANHWPLAVEAHAANHPRTTHSCQDLRQADWTTLPEYDLLLAAPACQGHSQAAQPGRAGSGRTRRHHDALRATAWAIVDCVDVTEPAAIVVENVPDFRRWRLYPQWRDCLEYLGYSISEHMVVASRLGVPQRRRRLFVVGLRGKPALRVDAPRGREPAFGPCVDWRAGNWRPIAGASAAVRRRIANGRKRHGDRFLTQHVSNHPGVGLDEPIRTITTKDQWAVVRGRMYRPLTIRENARGMGFPDDYAWPTGATRGDAVRGLGNAVPPAVGEWITTQVQGAL